MSRARVLGRLLAMCLLTSRKGLAFSASGAHNVGVQEYIFELYLLCFVLSLRFFWAWRRANSCLKGTTVNTTHVWNRAK